jgi:hypothetical protein
MGDEAIVLYCHAGCDTAEILAAKGLTFADLYQSNDRATQPRSPRRSPVTIADVVAAKHLPERLLVDSGWQNERRGIRIPYRNVGGQISPRTHIRRALEKPDSGPKFTWDGPGGCSLSPYGEWRLGEARQQRRVIITEGETDTITCWHAGLAALGIPGASTVRTALRPDHLQDIDHAVISKDADAGGDAFVKTVYETATSAAVPKITVLDMPAGCKDLNDWYRRCGSVEAFTKEFLVAIATAPAYVPNQAPVGGEETASAPRLATILDDAPAEMSRPLCIVNGHALAASWVHLDQGDDDEQHLVVVRDDGVLFCDVPLQVGSKSLAELGASVHLPQPVHDRYRWSGAGVNRYAAGERPHPVDVYRRVVRVIDHHVRFEKSLGGQPEMCELVAAYVLHTYFLEASNVASYIWYQGERGAGKTQALKTTTSLGFLGMQLLGGSTTPTLRDLSDYGALIGLDDAENVSKPDFDEDKRALFLSGNTRGSHITVKELSGPKKGAWTTRHVNIFSPRVFDSIRAPDAVMASRCIQIPMCRTAVNLPDPADVQQWPVLRERIRDDLWALALANLVTVRGIDVEIVQHTDLCGRTLQPWRGVLTIARWLDAQGVDGLFERMTALSARYQLEREDLEGDDPVRLAIHCLGDMQAAHGNGVVVFQTSELTQRMNAMARQRDLAEEGKEFTTPHKVGRMLGRLRFPRPPNLPGPRRWQMTREDLDTLASAHGVHALQSAAIVPSDNGAPQVFEL